MRRFAFALVLVALPLALVACGGGGKKTTTSTTAAAPPDPGKVVVAQLLTAAGSADRKALWNLLSKPSQKRLGPTYAQFAAGPAASMEQALKPFETAKLAPLISQSVSQEFGLVAVRNGAKALAFPLRLEGGTWKVETPGPITFAILGPQPGSSSAVAQVAVEVKSPGVIGDALIFVDGKPLAVNLTPNQGDATVFANLSKALPPGVHIAVAFAVEGHLAGAEAWSFTATKPS
jgi:hypothetical protein